MKKLLTLMLALAVVLSISAVAQEASSQGMGKTDKAAAAPLKDFRGTVKEDGKTFVDADGKSWGVMNPEAFKGHEGHEVSIKAHVYKDKDQIHVMSVKMAKEKKADKM